MVTEKRIMIDADHNDVFIAELEGTVPENDRYRCRDKEIWLVRREWKKFVVGLAKQYYDEVKVELRDWN